MKVPLSSFRSSARHHFTVVLLTASITGGAPAQTAAPVVDFGLLDLEQLAQIKIITVSKRPQAAWSTPAAVTVVSADELNRSGATTLPEALQYVPGLNVAQISADNWAIGARGFQWQYANKLLVMIDGRSIYSPLSGGVRWEDNLVMLDDLDRIEVVRGPGSAIWGANAVNGVINVVSRSAFETVGTRVTAGAGNELRSSLAVREGIQLGETAALRIYGLHRRTAPNLLPTGAPGGDDTRITQGGFRGDWHPSASDRITLHGDLYSSRSEYTRTFTTLSAPPTYVLNSSAPITARGANLLGRWRHEANTGTFVESQVYWDWGERWRPQNGANQTTFDTTLEFGTALGSNHEITGGTGYRSIDGKLTSGLFKYAPETLQPGLFSAFLQDTITLSPGRWILTVGSKYERHRFTGGSMQPTVRLTFAPSPALTIWASAGRAIRNPTWSEEVAAFDARVIPPGTEGGLPTTIRVLGDPELKPESLVAYEFGTRWQITDQVSAELAAYSFDYRNYVLVSFGNTFTQTNPPALVREARYQNGIRGESYGGEFIVRAEPAPWLRLTASHSHVDIQLHTVLSDPFGYEQDETTTPDHVTRVEADLQFGNRWAWHVAARHVGAVRYYGIPAYSDVNTRIGFRPTPAWEIALMGRNLLDAQHPEYDSALNRRLTEIRRSVSLQFRHDF